MLNTKEVFKQIIYSINQTIMSKRSIEDVQPSTSKKFANDFNVTKKSQMKHFTIDQANFELSQEQIKSLFKSIRIMGLDLTPDRNNNVTPHWHILGEEKISQRNMRDMSILNLRNADIKGGLEAKAFFLTANIKFVDSQEYWDNCIKYIKKYTNVYEDKEILFKPPLNPLWDQMEKQNKPSKHSKEDMDRFRKQFPIINSWKQVAAQRGYKPHLVKFLTELEAQRKYEEGLRDLTVEEKHQLLPNMPILNHAKDLRTQLISHDNNSGVCMILCGGSGRCKSTINRIIANSLGEYATWPGSQWIQKDNLKFDTAARQGISTIIVEEMHWIDIQHRITLDKTINSIKEQLTGAGMDVRLAKTKTAIQDDIKFKMDYLLISMNETEYVNYGVLSRLIRSKPEYKRRFILVNIDDDKYNDIVECRNRQNENWQSNYVHMEWLAGKAIKNPDVMNELNQLDLERSFREEEISSLVAFLEDNPNIFDIEYDPASHFEPITPVQSTPIQTESNDDIIEMTDREVNEEMVKGILKDIINTIN